MAYRLLISMLGLTLLAGVSLWIEADRLATYGSPRIAIHVVDSPNGHEARFAALDEPPTTGTLIRAIIIWTERRQGPLFGIRTEYTGAVRTRSNTMPADATQPNGPIADWLFRQAADWVRNSGLPGSQHSDVILSGAGSASVPYWPGIAANLIALSATLSLCWTIGSHMSRRARTTRALKASAYLWPDAARSPRRQLYLFRFLGPPAALLAGIGLVIALTPKVRVSPRVHIYVDLFMQSPQARTVIRDGDDSLVTPDADYAFSVRWSRGIYGFLFGTRESFGGFMLEVDSNTSRKLPRETPPELKQLAFDRAAAWVKTSGLPGSVEFGDRMRQGSGGGGGRTYWPGLAANVSAAAMTLGLGYFIGLALDRRLPRLWTRLRCPTCKACRETTDAFCRRCGHALTTPANAP